jgi:putative Holliday junction resolvase
MNPELDETRIMGIDYGKKRIGISLSDPTKTFAYSFSAFSNDKNFINRLVRLVRERNVVKIILGLPSSDFKSSHLLAEKVRKLKIKLESKLKIEVIFWDEEYSSVIAKGKILESVSKKNKRKDKGIIDSYSAAVILQEYLDSRQYQESS